MFTTVCDAVSTNRWLESNASQVNRPVTAAATNTVASETQTTSARFGCRRGGGPGLLSRTLTGFGASRLTPAAGEAVPRAGPAARASVPKPCLLPSRLPWSQHQINPVLRGRQFVSTGCVDASSPVRVDELT